MWQHPGEDPLRGGAEVKVEGSLEGTNLSFVGELSLRGMAHYKAGFSGVVDPF